MNDRIFTRVDEIDEAKPEKLNQTNEAPLEVIDIDDKEALTHEKSGNYDSIVILETRSEGNKDDQNSLENVLNKSMKQNNKKQKKINNDRKNKNKTNYDKSRQNNEKSIKIEEVKQTHSSIKDFESKSNHSAGGTETYIDSTSQDFKFGNKIDTEFSSNAKFNKKQLSCDSDIKSTMSEEKDNLKKKKNSNFINNSSEVSSVNNSSTVSLYENHKTNSSSKQSAK